VCGSHACRGAWIGTSPLSGVRGESGVLELAPEQPRCENQRLRLSWPGCVLRPLRGLRDGSEALDSSPGLPRPVRNQPSQRQSADPVSFGRRDCGSDAGASRYRPLSGGWCADCADGRRATLRPLREAAAHAVRNADGRSSLSREAGHDGPAATAPATPKRNGALRGVCPLYTVAVRWMTCLGPGSDTESNVLSSRQSTRKGGLARGCDGRLQLRCKLTASFDPARSISCLRSAPQADVDRKVVRR